MSQQPAPDFSTAGSSPETRDAIERERLRLAHDLHDELGSRLVAVKMALAPLQQPPTDNPEMAQAAISHANVLIDQAIDTLQTVLQALRPAELDLGLVAALQQITDDFRHPALACTFWSSEREIDAGPDLTLGMLRICREALANIARHAQARTAAIRLEQSTDADGTALLQLDISDDGIGMTGAHAKSVPASIARRVQALGGVLERRLGPETGGSGKPGYHLQIKLPMAPKSSR